MANLRPYARNSTTGQFAPVSTSDVLIDTSGNPIVPPSPKIVSTTNSITLTSTGTTNLYTVPSGKTLVVTGAIVRVTSFSGTLSTNPSLGIGVASGEDDIFASVSVAGLGASGKFYNFVNAGGSAVTVAAASVVKVGVDTAATGTGLTLTVAIDLVGYFQDETTGQGGGVTTGQYIGVMLTKSDTQSIATGTFTDITWNNEVWDPYGYHSTVTNTNRITIPSGLAGYYASTMSIRFQGSWVGQKNVYVSQYNSSGTKLSDSEAIFQPDAGNFQLSPPSKVFSCSVGDYLVARVFHDKGSAQSIGIGSSYTEHQEFFSAYRIGT